MADQLATGIQWVVDDSTGAITGYRRKIAGVDTAFSLDADAIQSSVSGGGATEIGGVEILRAGMAGVTISGTAPGRSISTVVVGGETYFGVTASGAGYIEISVPAFGGLTADTATIEYIAGTSISQFTPYLSTTAGYAVFAAAPKTLPTTGSTSDWRVIDRHAAMYVNPHEWVKNGYSRETLENVWTAAKLRITFTGAATAYIRSISIGHKARRGRICVVSDDGYTSWVRLASPILARAGIPYTMAVIPSAVGTGDFASIDELHMEVQRGNMMVAHGPDGYSGNIFTRWASDEDALADMVRARDWLLAQGLTTSSGAKCYIWPQGQYARTVGDGFLQMAYDAGFSCGRSVYSSATYPQLRSMSGRCLSKLTAPIIGHTYAGATNTADDAAETTNIATIVGRIQEAAANSCDAYIMFHRVCARGAATSGGIFIEVDRLATIAAAIKAEVDAGRLQAVTMGVMADGTDSPSLMPA